LQHFCPAIENLSPSTIFTPYSSSLPHGAAMKPSLTGLRFGGGIVKSMFAALTRGSSSRRPIRTLYLGIGIVSALFAPLCPASAGAALECPETGKGAVPALISPVQAKILAAGGYDLGNETNELITRLRAERPGMSFAEITNELMAAYCPIIASTSLSPEAKLTRLNTFGALVRERLASEIMTPESSILAVVPLTPDVYRALRNKAEQAGKVPSEFMSAILTQAAAEPQN
jgi:hypothetical protein